MVKINAQSDGGGAVSLNEDHGVWASYKVAGVGNEPKPEILYAGVTLNDGRAVQFFANRENNLVVVDLIDANGKGGVEILRKTLDPVPWKRRS